MLLGPRVYLSHTHDHRDKGTKGSFGTRAQEREPQSNQPMEMTLLLLCLGVADSPCWE